MAVTSKPIVATAAAQALRVNTPLKIKNSPTKPFRPGRPSEEKSVIPIKPQNTGAALRMPPKSSMPRKPRFRCSKKANKAEQCAGGDAMVEHLENHPVQRGCAIV